MAPSASSAGLTPPAGSLGPNSPTSVPVVAVAPECSTAQPGARRYPPLSMAIGTEAARSGRLRTALRRLRNPFDPATTLGRQRILGILLMIPLFAFFYRSNRFPKLDTIRDEVLIATQEEAAAGALPASGLSRCFQGFCFGDDTGLLQRWWEFSINYIELVTVGMIFAFLVAGIADALLFPGSASGAFGRKGIKGTMQGFVVGPVVMLCSACIVPVANSFRKKGASVEATVAVTQSSSTLNVPALVMLLAVFSPLLWGSRLALSVAGVLLLGAGLVELIQLETGWGVSDLEQCCTDMGRRGAAATVVGLLISLLVVLVAVLARRHRRTSD